MNKPKLNFKKIILAAFIGSIIMTIVITAFNYFIFDKFSLQRTSFYFIAGLVLYGFLAYRSNKKHQNLK